MEKSMQKKELFLIYRVYYHHLLLHCILLLEIYIALQSINTGIVTVVTALLEYLNCALSYTVDKVCFRGVGSQCSGCICLIVAIA